MNEFFAIESAQFDLGIMEADYAYESMMNELNFKLKYGKIDSDVYTESAAESIREFFKKLYEKLLEIIEAVKKKIDEKIADAKTKSKLKVVKDAYAKDKTRFKGIKAKFFDAPRYKKMAQTYIDVASKAMKDLADLDPTSSDYVSKVYSINNRRETELRKIVVEMTEGSSDYMAEIDFEEKANEIINQSETAHKANEIFNEYVRNETKNFMDMCENSRASFINKLKSLKKKTVNESGDEDDANIPSPIISVIKDFAREFTTDMGKFCRGFGGNILSVAATLVQLGGYIEMGAGAFGVLGGNVSTGAKMVVKGGVTVAGSKATKKVIRNVKNNKYATSDTSDDGLGY